MLQFPGFFVPPLARLKRVQVVEVVEPPPPAGVGLGASAVPRASMVSSEGASMARKDTNVTTAEEKDTPVIAKEEDDAAQASAAPPSKRENSLRNLVRHPKGVSGNPSGRRKIEPAVRRFARKFDRQMCAVLAALAMNPKVPPSERRRAAMDLIAVGNGRPALIQEIAGKDGAPAGPLVNLSFALGLTGAALAPAEVYRLMSDGTIPPDPDHESFRPAIEAPAPDEPEDPSS